MGLPRTFVAVCAYFDCSGAVLCVVAALLDRPHSIPSDAWRVKVSWSGRFVSPRPSSLLDRPHSIWSDAEHVKGAETRPVRAERKPDPRSGRHLPFRGRTHMVPKVIARVKG